MKTIVLALLRSRGAQEAMKRNFWLALWLAAALGVALSVPHLHRVSGNGQEVAATLPVNQLLYGNMGCRSRGHPFFLGPANSIQTPGRRQATAWRYNRPPPFFTLKCGDADDPRNMEVGRRLRKRSQRLGRVGPRLPILEPT